MNWKKLAIIILFILMAFGAVGSIIIIGLSIMTGKP